MSALSAKTQKKAEDELHEKPGKKDQDIEILRRLVTSNKALTCRTDAAWLVRFLRARKFDVERANQLIINYFSIREEYKERFTDLRPSALRHVYDKGVSIILPHRDRNGCKIMYFRPGKWDPKDFPIWDILRTNVMNLEKMIEDEETQVNGVIVIINLEGVGWDQAKAIDREYAKVFTKTIQEAFPMRLKALCVINEPGIFDVVFAIVKQFLSEKFLSRINIFGTDLTKLHAVFDPAILPEELGGDLPHGDTLAQDWSTKMMASEAMFVDMAKYKIVTPKTGIIKGKVEANSNASGGPVVGSGTFRKLNVD